MAIMYVKMQKAMVYRRLLRSALLVHKKLVVAGLDNAVKLHPYHRH